MIYNINCTQWKLFNDHTYLYFLYSLSLFLSLDLDSIETKIKKYFIINSILIICKSMLCH